MDGYHVGIRDPISNVHYSSRHHIKQSFQHLFKPDNSSDGVHKKKISYFIFLFGSQWDEIRCYPFLRKMTHKVTPELLFHGEGGDKIREEK